MWLSLIPEGSCRDVRTLLQISSVVPPAQVLDGCFKVFFEADRIDDVPSVQAETLLRTICSIRTDYLAKSRIRSCEFGESSIAVKIV